MQIIDNILLALEALKTNKLRALLTMLGIIIGIGAVIAINTVGSSLTGSVTDTMSSIGASSITVSLTQKSESDSSTSNSNVSLKMFASSNPDEEDLITDEMIEEFKAAFSDKVAYVEVTRSVGMGTLSISSSTSTTSTDSTESSDSESSESDSSSSSSNSVSITGVNDDYVDSESITMLYGRFIENEKDGVRKVCVVSDYFVENTLGINNMLSAIGESFDVTINNTIYTFYIEGVYEYEEDTTSSLMSSSDSVTTSMYIPIELAQKLNGDDDGYQSITVMVNNDTDVDTFLTICAEYFESYYTNNDTWTVEATSLSTVISTLTSIVSTISYAISAIAAISLLVGGIGVMNIMLVSITERTREIGTRKALGAPNSSIRIQFITESIVICLIGGMIGIVLGVVGGSVISTYLGYSASPDIKSIVLAVGFSALVGVVFGYAPANKAAKLDPIEALRYE